MTPKASRHYGEKMFATTDSRIEKLEKKISRIENSIKIMEDSFSSVMDVVKKLNEENSSLRKTMKYMETQKQEINRIKEEKRQEESVLIPIKNRIRENIEFVQQVAAEGLLNEKENISHNGEGLKLKISKNITEEDLLSSLSNGAIDADRIAWKFGVHRAQIDAWASKLNKQGSVVLRPSGRKMFISLKKK